LTLGHDEVRVYYCLLDQVGDELHEDAWATLDSAERARAGRFVFASGRTTFVLAHGLLRRALSNFADVAPSNWRFVAGEFGKPALADGLPRLHFNLAHTDGLVACAIARKDVGVDVEAIDRRVHPLEIASRFFSPAEVIWIEQASDQERHARFLELWTLKEAYVKGIGSGLSHPLNTFGFDLTSLSTIRFEAPTGEEPSAWQFALYAPSDRHRLAVAARCAEALRISIDSLDRRLKAFTEPACATIRRNREP
jgi:4'-phosphopantetheinyl transferase